MAAERDQAFDEQVERVRASGVLSRSHGLQRLFDYLADPVRRGRTLGEADVAFDVFGKATDLAGDASVRVYIHRLRRKLGDFYAGSAGAGPHRLVIPVGEYRLDLDVAEDATAAPAPARARRQPSWRWAAAAVAFLACVNLAAWAVLASSSGPDRELARLARTPLWSDLGGDRPVLVVVGDYYIFGDTEGGLEPKRMIREFEVNSPADLDAFLMSSPQFLDRYVDLDTYYTPVGATVALRDVMPLVRRVADGRRVDVITSSQLTPDQLKSADIVYVGYLSGMRLLQEPIFSRSRLEPGQTYDELVDRKSRKSFVSGAGDVGADRQSRDFGYLAALEGPAGNHLVVIAGMRDIGLMQAAEVAADLRAQAGVKREKGAPLELLYSVQGVGRTNLSATRVELQP